MGERRAEPLRPQDVYEESKVSPAVPVTKTVPLTTAYPGTSPYAFPPAPLGTVYNHQQPKPHLSSAPVNEPFGEDGPIPWKWLGVAVLVVALFGWWMWPPKTELEASYGKTRVEKITSGLELMESHQKPLQVAASEEAIYAYIEVTKVPYRELETMRTLGWKLVRTPSGGTSPSYFYFSLQ